MDNNPRSNCDLTDFEKYLLSESFFTTRYRMLPASVFGSVQEALILKKFFWLRIASFVPGLALFIFVGIAGQMFGAEFLIKMIPFIVFVIVSIGVANSILEIMQNTSILKNAAETDTSELPEKYRKRAQKRILRFKAARIYNIISIPVTFIVAFVFLWFVKQHF